MIRNATEFKDRIERQMEATEFLKYFGEKLTKSRRIRELSLEAFAEKAKVPIGVLDAFEHGSEETNTRDFLKILAVFNKLEALDENLLPYENLFELHDMELKAAAEK